LGGGRVETTRKEKKKRNHPEIQNIVCVTHFVTVSKESLDILEEYLLKPLGKERVSHARIWPCTLKENMNCECLRQVNEENILLNPGLGK
jgi:hypothetical protein